MALLKKLRKAKQVAPPNEKPDIVKTHLRNMIIMPEMVGSIVGVYNGKTFNQVEIKPQMIGWPHQDAANPNRNMTVVSNDNIITLS